MEALFKRDKGSAGDYRGDKKLKARNEIKYIFLMLDFTSPIRELEESERRAQAMSWAGLEEKDMDEVLMEAYTTYDEILKQSSRALITLRALKQGMDAFDDFWKNINFKDKDKMGKLIYTPESFAKAVKDIGASYDTLEMFEQRVMADLIQDSGIRGKAEKGDKEGKKRENVWEEKPRPSSIVDRNFIELADLIHTDEEDTHVI